MMKMKKAGKETTTLRKRPSYTMKLRRMKTRAKTKTKRMRRRKIGTGRPTQTQQKQAILVKVVRRWMRMR